MNMNALAMHKAATFDDALDKAEMLIEGCGLGHTASIHIKKTGSFYTLGLKRQLRYTYFVVFPHPISRTTLTVT